MHDREQAVFLGFAQGYPMQERQAGTTHARTRAAWTGAGAGAAVEVRAGVEVGGCRRAGRRRVRCGCGQRGRGEGGGGECGGRGAENAHVVLHCVSNGAHSGARPCKSL